MLILTESVRDATNKIFSCDILASTRDSIHPLYLFYYIELLIPIL